MARGGDYESVLVTEVIRETAAGVQVSLEDGRKLWLPKSAIGRQTPAVVGELDVYLLVAGWLVRKVGLT